VLETGKIEPCGGSGFRFLGSSDNSGITGRWQV